MRCWMVGLVVAMVAAGGVAGEERVAASRAVSVGLFKNGLAVVTREVKVGGGGTWVVTDVPSPVHGTFWIESGGDVEARVTMRKMDVEPRTNTAADFQEQFAGKRVTVFFRGRDVPPATGKVAVVRRPSGAAAWSRRYQPPSYRSHYWQQNRPRAQGRFLILDTDKGREYVDSSMIARLTVAGPAGKVTERRPVVMLTAKGGKASTVRLSYLTQGLSWAPSYRVDISDGKRLTIEQKAVIKNELTALKDAEVFLISGFPSVKFAHVTSPLSLRQTWAAFFQQLSARPQPRHRGHVVTQQRAVAANVAPGGGPSLSAMPSGEGPDIHYQPVGKRSLAEGDSVMLRVAKAEAGYERIVEWIVPDTRKADGRYIQEYERRQDPEKYQDAAWDALRFKNPLPFPMTTAAAMIVGKGKFLGETTSFWVNKGEETTLHVTKALSLRTRHSEQEEPGARKPIYIGGDDYYRTTVKAGLTVNNHRAEKIALVIRRRFSGDLIQASGRPKCVLREEGAWCVNRRNELTWSLSLKPGEEKTLAFRYTVLVNR